MPPAFDTAAAERFAEQDDRDEAWFFAGREAERSAFVAAARQAFAPASDRGRPRAVFRIFQGAPGCGKTSFVRRMETERNDLLFVVADDRHLADADTLMRRIAREALEQRKGANVVSGLAVVALEATRMQTAAETVARAAGDRAAREAGLVIWTDEAQTVDDSCKALATAHRGGLGVPALVVLSGLPTTSRRVRGIPGLSRLADAAIVNMGSMSNAECAESTKAMLAAFGIHAPAAMDEAASRIAAMAFGWPQHLKGAQKSLARALLTAKGHLGQVDMTQVARESDARRSAYYTQRLDNGVLADDPRVALAIISKIGSAGHLDCDIRSMLNQVRAEAKAAGSLNQTDKAAMALLEDMVEHSILVRTRSPKDVVLDRWQVAVPSMAAWADEQALRKPASQ